MGRGKKKDKKGTADEGTEEVPSMSSLSLSESQPSASSTSQGLSAPEPTPAPQPEEEEGLGLGLGGSRKKKPPKKKGQAEAAPSGPAQARPPPEVAAPQPPQPTPAPESTASKPEEEEEDGLGLGLGGARKKRPRKKKGPAEAAAPEPAQAPAQPPSQPPLQPPSQLPLQPQTTPSTAPGPPPGLQAGPPGFQNVSVPSGPPPGATPWSRQQTPPAAGPPPVQTQLAQATLPAQPVQTPVAGKKSRGDVYSGPSVSPPCLFKVPSKILGNTVLGEKIQILVNYLPMIIKPMKIHRYDVSFNPDKPKKMLPKAYMISKTKHFPKHLIAFDQMKNIYALKPLPGVDSHSRYITNVEFEDNNGKQMNFEVSYKFTGIVDFSTIIKYMETQGTSLNPPTEAIQCIDVILRQGTLENYIKAGRQFFKRPAKPIDLGDGLEMWTGLFQSAIFTSRPFINIDVAHKGFPRHQTLIDALTRDFRLSTDQPIERQRGRGVESFKMFIKGLRVIANIGGDTSTKGMKREFICNELVAPPNRIQFTMTDPKTNKEFRMTVADYFAKEKKIRLRYPDLNCMWVGPKDKKIYYPMELLSVVFGQPMNKQLNEIQLSTMVREAATPPDERKRKIHDVIKDMNYSQNAYFKEFGLDIKNEFFPVEARVLEPPQLDVGDRKLVKPMNGSWQANRLQTPQALESWGFIGLEVDAYGSNAENFLSLIRSCGNQMGMRVAEPKMVTFNVKLNELINVLFDALAKEIRVLFIVVSGRGKDYYHKVKQLAEREVGILTQCVKENTAARRMNQQTAKNIILKVNSKLMGVNQALDASSMPRCIKQGGVMVVGADVTHPSPDQSSVPSIAAVTASMDMKCYRYNIQLSIQTPKKEVIVEFEDMMLEHLRVFRAKNQNRLPRKIFVFRDGVSEGQFAQVMNSELVAVRRAYATLAGPEGGKPEVLFLLVQKRHHTRFFLGANNAKNVKPGTVVDTHIVHARELDFYLVSHQAIKGTARPTRYHAVCNDGNIPHDEVEQLTYYLCHLYSRCMRSVSYPTPTYYAHLACLRARSLTHGEKFDNDKLERQPQRLKVLDKMLASSRMFFV